MRTHTRIRMHAHTRMKQTRKGAAVLSLNPKGVPKACVCDGKAQLSHDDSYKTITWGSRLLPRSAAGARHDLDTQRNFSKHLPWWLTFTWYQPSGLCARCVGQFTVLLFCPLLLLLLSVSMSLSLLLSFLLSHVVFVAVVVVVVAVVVAVVAATAFFRKTNRPHPLPAILGARVRLRPLLPPLLLRLVDGAGSALHLLFYFYCSRWPGAARRAEGASSLLRV